MKKKFKINNVSLVIAIALLIVMYLFGAAKYNRFGSLSTILNLFNDNAYLIVVSVGMTFVLLTGGIDISVASIVAFTDVYIDSSVGDSQADTLAGEMNIIFAIAIVIIAWYILRFTRFGRAVYAVGSNEQSAQYMGLNVKGVKVGVYAINGFCSALGGILFSFYTLAGYSLQNMGMELDAISSAVIGGTLLTGGVGTVIGSMVGVLIQGIIQTIVTYQNLNTWWTKVTIAAILCFFIVIQRLIAIRAEKDKAA